jgi:hypothetical protein
MGSVTYTGEKSESSRLHRGDRVDPYTGRASRHTYREENQVVTYTGRLTRHLYRETTRPFSMTEGFRPYSHTGESDPTLIQGDI